MTRLLKTLRAPIIQAPLAGSQGFALAAAVSRAGGLGSIPAAMHTPMSLLQEFQSYRSVTSQPVNINFFAHTTPTTVDATRLSQWHDALRPYYNEFRMDTKHIPTGGSRHPFSSEFAEIIEELQPAVVSFHFGLPEEQLMARVRRSGAQIWSSATTLEEALWLQAHKVDAIIVQGVEAGGHRGMFLSDDVTAQPTLRDLLLQIRGNGTITVPLIAAGGITTADDIRALRPLVDAVQIGTAYLTTPEATTSPFHRAALKSPSLARETALTNLFTGHPARGIVNRFMRELGPMSELPPPFPLATAALGPLRAAAESGKGGEARGDFTPLWAGQSAHRMSRHDVPAGELTSEFIAAWNA